MDLKFEQGNSVRYQKVGQQFAMSLHFIIHNLHVPHDVFSTQASDPSPELVG